MQCVVSCILIYRGFSLLISILRPSISNTAMIINLLIVFESTSALWKFSKPLVLRRY